MPVITPGLAARLLAWYGRNQRRLPWRATRDPFRIWISEVMLQQTRAAAVIPYYRRFLRRFPDVKSLARSSESELLRLWSGLGYYSRARNLLRAAQQVVAGGGGLPRTCREWTALPGVGPYTAAAVSSIAFGEPMAVLDGNVARVVARLENHRGDVRSPRVREELRQRAQAMLDRRRPGQFNQAMMELGATVCLPRRPRCPVCPLARWCEARRLGVAEQLPIRLGPGAPLAERITVAVARRNGRVLLRRRPDSASQLAGFWELPQAVGAETIPPLRLAGPRGEFRHAITRHQYSVSVRDASLRGRTPAGWRWLTPGEIKRLPLTTVTRKALGVEGPDTTKPPRTPRNTKKNKAW